MTSKTPVLCVCISKCSLKQRNAVITRNNTAKINTNLSQHTEDKVLTAFLQ